MRKQLLLGSTALIVGALGAPGIAAAAEPLRLEVRGYMDQFFGLGDVDNDSNVDDGITSHFSDGEVHFKGSTELDNGLTVGVDIQLEGNNRGDQIDEEYAWLSGDFGKLVIGSENLPDYLTFISAPNVGVPINSGWISVWAPIPSGMTTGFRSSLQTTNLTLTNDTFSIGYQSPRFSGFRFVAGYAPTDANSGSPKNAVTDEDLEIHDVFSVGLQYKQSFNGVDVGVAVGYEHGESPDTSSADDPQIYKAGANISVGGFTVGGSYGVYDSDRRDEGIAYDVGVSYATGPWGVSAKYFHGEEDGGAGADLAIPTAVLDSDDDEVDAFVAAVSYSLGPGITATGSLFHGNWEDELGTESESTMGIVGLFISF